MASSFKTLLSNDVAQTKTLLHEAIPITGSIISGTYSDLNIKKFAHDMFESVYDYPYASSSANHIFDMTFGIASGSSLYLTSSVDYAKKNQIYNQMAQVLVGFDETNTLRPFDEDGQLSDGAKHRNVMFLNFSRLLVKDEVKKGSFNMTFFPAGPGTDTLIQDTNAQNEYRVNSPAGEYGILYIATSSWTGSSQYVTNSAGLKPIGLIYYQAGVVALSLSTGSVAGTTGSLNQMYGAGTAESFLTGSNITSIADSIRGSFSNIAFNNTTELNSTVYFCRVDHNDFNYSSNPTFLSGSKIVTKNSTQDEGATYISSVGLYSPDGALMATAKLSELLKKTASTSFTIRTMLQY